MTGPSSQAWCHRYGEQGEELLGAVELFLLPDLHSLSVRRELAAPSPFVPYPTQKLRSPRSGGNKLSLSPESWSLNGAVGSVS